MKLPDVYKINLKTAADDRTELIAYCLKHSVIGVGWGAHYFTNHGDPPPADFDAYIERAVACWGARELGRVCALHDAEIGSLVWFRDLRGNFYLARISGEWQLLTDPEAERLDLGNIRSVEYRLVGSAAEVPGAVLRSYAGPKQLAFNRIHDRGAGLYTALLASELFGTPPPATQITTGDVLDSLLGPLDVEDLVASYLQDTRGYVALPARYGKHTAVYEYILKNRRDGHLAAVQVKTGDALIPTQTLDQRTADKWFAYVAASQVLPSWVEQIARCQLIGYMDSQPAALPPVVARWMEARERR